jgi:hypothetical protein
MKTDNYYYSIQDYFELSFDKRAALRDVVRMTNTSEISLRQLTAETFFLIRIVGGEVQTGSTRHVGH